MHLKKYVRAFLMLFHNVTKYLVIHLKVLFLYSFE